MEDRWPSSVRLRGQALNHPELRWLKTVVVSVREKARRTCQVGTSEEELQKWESRLVYGAVIIFIVLLYGRVLAETAFGDGDDVEGAHVHDGAGVKAGRQAARRARP